MSNTMLCPVCGFDFCHIQSVCVKQGCRVDLVNRHGNTVRVHDDLQSDPLVSIKMWCENGHHFDVSFQFRKGQTLVSQTEDKTIENWHEIFDRQPEELQRT